MKKLVILLVVLAVAGVGWWVWRQSRPKAGGPAPIKTVKAARGDIELHVEATGSVESNLDVDVKSKASGEVIQLPYDVSGRVSKYIEGRNEANTLLAALDPTDELRHVDRVQAARDAGAATLTQASALVAIAREAHRVSCLEANAQVDSARARLDLDLLTLRRQEGLVARGAVTQSEVDSATAAVKISQAQLELAQARQEALRALELAIDQREAEVQLARANLAAADAELADANQRLKDTRIYSPIDGVITRRDAQIGQIIASGIVNVAGGTTLMTVSDMSRMFVLAEVHESDIGRLVETGRLGQEADITADAYPGRRFRGQVVQITPRGSIEAKVVNFLVKVEVLSEDKDLLLPKMTADVRILASAHKGVLLLPDSCLHYEKDRPYVEVKQGGEFVRRWVKLGLNDGTQAEVLEGLEEGEEVASGGAVASRWVNAASVPATGPAR